MQDEVSAAAETLDAFSDETLKEHAVFQHAKQAEMKEMLSTVADGQIEMYKKACTDPWTMVLPRADSGSGIVLGNDELGEIDPPNTTHTGRCVVVLDN